MDEPADGVFWEIWTKKGTKTVRIDKLGEYESALPPGTKLCILEVTDNVDAWFGSDDMFDYGVKR